MDKKNYDFSGWLTKYGITCSDKRTIKHGAFKDANGMTVPLVYDHNHTDSNEVLGHCDLEERQEGIYAYGSFNDTPQGKNAKELVRHGDIVALSVYANRLKQNGNEVIHGVIREASLVLAGANPGAYIDNVMCHSDNPDENDGAIIQFVEYTSKNFLDHADSDNDKKQEEKQEMPEEKKPQEGEETIEDIVNTMNEKQKKAMYALIGAAMEEAKKDAVQHGEEDSNEEDEQDMNHNIFETQNGQENSKDVLRHAEGLDVIIKDAKKQGSLKESYLAHAADYGIDNIDYIFPEYKNVTNTPIIIDRPQGWVSKVMARVHHVPYSHIKSLYADITEDDARAKGYFKGNLKKDEVFGLLKRKTSPTTVYKKQKMDRDDILDITDFNVVTWIKAEMRGKLDEELARAFLFGDGRSSSSDEKIAEDRIRPIVSAESLFAITKALDASATTTAAKAANFIDKCIEAQEDYQGSGNVVAYVKTSYVTQCLLLKDTQGYRIYKSVNELATAMNVEEIVKIPNSIMPSGVISINVDLSDYYVGADKGGAINMFDDFDIDYNQEKYLIETRCSGTLVQPKSAMIITEAE